MKTRKYSFNENYFNNIDTEEKAYWLGFISADGCVYGKKNTNSKILEIGLALTDINHLEKFRTSINSNHRIIEKKNGCKISIVSRKLYDDLNLLGVTERKSKTLTSPSEELIPETLIHHYIRGYFDGDGGFTTHDNNQTFALNFCGTPYICKFILKKLEMEKINLEFKKGVEGFAQVRIKGNLQALEIANKIYKNATIFLDRKYRQYQSLVFLNEANNMIKELNDLEFKVKSIIATDMLKSGLTGKDIASVFNCGETNIPKYVKNYRKTVSDNKELQVINLINEGVTNKSEIHRITGFSRDYIRKIFKKIN